MRELKDDLASLRIDRDTPRRARWRIPLILLVLAALPTGSLVFVLSNLYGVYTQRSTGVIIASTFASVVTLSLLFNLLGVR